jgi:hypothetical protein
LGVERVGVNQHKAGLENAEGHDRVAETVRHLDRNSVTLGKA